MENRNARNYLTVCSLLASGSNKLSDTANKSGLSTPLVSSVLESLAEIDIVEREESISQSSRKPIWRIKNRPVAFYYRFRYPLSSYNEEEMMRNYHSHINVFLGFSFEKLCSMALPKIITEPIREMGRWWGGNPVTKAEEEIDITAWTDDGELTACECRYIPEDISSEVIATLRRRAALISGGKRTSLIFFTKEKTAPDTKAYPDSVFFSLDEVFSFLTSGD